MKIRVNTLWRVPVFCAVAGVACYWLTITLGGMFFAVKTVEADGAVSVSVDPLRSTIFMLVLFAAALLVGGLLAVRSMTRAEIALSAAIAVVLSLAFGGVLYFLAQYTPVMAACLASLLEWSNELGTVLSRLLNETAVTPWIGRLAPFLLVPFGRADEKTEG